MYDKREVMEVTLSGHWYEIVKGQGVCGDRPSGYRKNHERSQAGRREGVDRYVLPCLG